MGVAPRGGIAVVVIVVMIVVRMPVVVVCTSSRRAFERAQRGDERLPLHPQQSRADHDDERVARDFDHVHGSVHRRRRRIQERRGNTHEHHGHKRLQQRGREREDHAAPPGLAIGDDIGRDHRLAVARTGGMEDAVEE
jgi:hypothetical protein